MIRVIGDRVLVALPPPDDEIVSAAGLVLVRDPDAARLPTRGIVIEIGDKRGTLDFDDVRALIDDMPNHNGFIDADTFWVRLKDVGPAAFDVAVGECVLFPLGAGEEVTYEGVSYVLLRESDIIGVVEPQEVPA